MWPGGAALAALVALLVGLLLATQRLQWCPSAAELLHAGQSAAAQQRWLDARGAFSLALEQLPASDEGTLWAHPLGTHSRAQFLLGFTHARLGHHREAADAYRSALATAPQPSTEPHWNLALSLKELGQLEAAVAHFATAAELAPPPGNPTALFQQGRALESLGRTVEAVDGPLRAAVSLAASSAGAAATDSDYPLALAMALASLGRNSEAVSFYSSAAQMTHANAKRRPAIGGMELGAILTNWGNSLHGMGKLREAVLVYRDAVGAASEGVELEATEALAATLTTLEQEEREQRQQSGGAGAVKVPGLDRGQMEDEGWLEDTAAYWVERADAIGRSQEAHYASIIATRLPPLADFTSDEAAGSSGSMRMWILRPADEGSGGPVGGLGEIQGLASAEECGALIALAKAAGLRPATVDSGRIDRSLRRSSSVCIQNDEFCSIKNDGFCIENVGFCIKMMILMQMARFRCNYTPQPSPIPLLLNVNVDRVLSLVVLQQSQLEGVTNRGGRRGEVKVFIIDDEFGIKQDEFCIKMDEFCIEKDELFIKPERHRC